MPVLGEQRLRVELHPFHREAAVAQPHDLAVFRLRGHGEAGGQALALHHQRVIPGCHEFIRNPGENSAAIVADARSLAVHDPPGPHYLSAEGLADRLVAEANAEERHAAREPRDQPQGDAGIVGRPGTRREHDVGRRERRDFVDGNLVVAKHPHLGPELAQVLRQVVSERVVVVDQRDHAASASFSLEASSAAFSSARALCWVSSHSARGSESATMPAAAWAWSLPSFSTAVRIAMATSMSPLKPRYPTAPL